MNPWLCNHWDFWVKKKEECELYSYTASLLYRVTPSSGHQYLLDIEEIVGSLEELRLNGIVKSDGNKLRGVGGLNASRG